MELGNFRDITVSSSKEKSPPQSSNIGNEETAKKKVCETLKRELELIKALRKNYDRRQIGDTLIKGALTPMIAVRMKIGRIMSHKRIRSR